jgi:hypothetical protein
LEVVVSVVAAVVAAAAAAVVVAVAVVAAIVTVVLNRDILRAIALSQIHAADKPVVQVNKALKAIQTRSGMTFTIHMCV